MTKAIYSSNDTENEYMKGYNNNGPNGSDTAAQAYLEIDDACLFDSGNSCYMSRTPSSAGNRKTWTFSTWVKRGKLGSLQTFLAAGNYTTPVSTARMYFDTDDTLNINWHNGSTSGTLTTNAVYRDVGACYHILFVLDTTEATASNRIKIYVNSSQVTSFSAATYPSLDEANLPLNGTTTHYVGRPEVNYPSAPYFDGYLADTHLIDGSALTPSSFGELDSNNNWVPKKYTGSYGTNGFHFDYSDSASLGDDTSGNSNDYTTSGLTTASQVSDTPTNNYCVLNAVHENGSAATFASGNTRITNSSAWANVPVTICPTSGKWYIECLAANYGSSGSALLLGVSKLSELLNNTNVGDWSGSIGIGVSTTPSPIFAVEGSYPTAPHTVSTGDKTLVAVDCDNGKAWLGFYDDSAGTTTWYSSAAAATGDPATGANPTMTFTASTAVAIIYSVYNNTGSYAIAAASDQWDGTCPSGFKALCTNNLPEPAILDPRAQFEPIIYDGTGAAQNITAIDFEPDLVWLKNRDASANNCLFDSVRPSGAAIHSDTTGAESDFSAEFTGILSNGFSLAQNYHTTNYNGESYVAWCWKEGATPGFDIVSYTGTGVAHTIAHNLGAVPEMMIVKDRSGTHNWPVYHGDVGNTAAVYLSATDAAYTYTAFWNNTSPTSSVFTIGTDNSVNANTNNFIAYLFASVEGFSKVGSYEGNGSADGTFVYCGFRPAFVMIKRTDDTSQWTIVDAVREPYNSGTSKRLYPNYNSAEASDAYGLVDKVANGFKLRVNHDQINASGGDYIFMAFAEAPFKYAGAR